MIERRDAPHISFPESFVVEPRHADRKRLSWGGKFLWNIGLWRWQFRNLGDRLTGLPIKDKNLRSLGRYDNYFSQCTIYWNVRQGWL